MLGITRLKGKTRPKSEAMHSPSFYLLAVFLYKVHLVAANLYVLSLEEDEDKISTVLHIAIII
jgi:hypothetical protein